MINTNVCIQMFIYTDSCMSSAHFFVGQPSTHVDWLHFSHPGSVQVRTSAHAGVHVRNNNGSGSKSWKKKFGLGGE